MGNMAHFFFLFCYYLRDVISFHDTFRFVCCLFCFCECTCLIFFFVFFFIFLIKFPRSTNKQTNTHTFTHTFTQPTHKSTSSSRPLTTHRTDKAKSPGLLWLARTRKLPSAACSSSSFSLSLPEICPWNHLHGRVRGKKEQNVCVCVCVCVFFFVLFLKKIREINGNLNVCLGVHGSFDLPLCCWVFAQQRIFQVNVFAGLFFQLR